MDDHSQDPSEAPTPPLTSFSSVFCTAAGELEEHCGAAAAMISRSPNLFDNELYFLLKAMEAVARRFKNSFKRWQSKPIDAEIKLTEREAFLRFNDVAREMVKRLEKEQ